MLLNYFSPRWFEGGAVLLYNMCCCPGNPISPQQLLQLQWINMTSCGNLEFYFIFFLLKSLSNYKAFADEPLGLFIRGLLLFLENTFRFILVETFWC